MFNIDSEECINEYKIEKLSRPIKGDNFRLWIYMDEEKDFDEPYKGESDIVDMSKAPVKVVYDKNVKTEVDELGEAIESEQKYPIESPIAEDLDLDIESDELEEATITTVGAGNFNPNDGVAKETWEKIVAANKIGTFDFMLEDMFPAGATSSQVNELLEKDSQWVLHMLGIVEEAGEAPEGEIMDAAEVDETFGFED